MSKAPKVVDFRHHRAISMFDEAIPSLEAYLSRADSEKAVAGSREAIANLIVGSCNMKPSLKQSLGVSNEALSEISAGGPIPKALVENFLAHLKSAREHATSCLND